MKPLGENDRRALLSLLADEDEHVQELLHEQFRAMGPDGCEFLESAARSAPAPARQTAARMLAEIRERHSVSAFQVFCREAGSDLDLERANWLLAKTRYPDLDEEPYLARLDQMAREIRGRLTGRETPRATIEVCNHYLFQMLDFRGNQQDYYDPDNSYLNRVLDRRLGIPISLSVLYLLLAKRLGLPLFGVSMPRHFLLTWRSPDVAFFIDPFNAGRVLDAEDCRGICERIAGGFNEEHLMPVTSRKIFIRQCRNLQAIYAERDARRAAFLQEALRSLTDR